MSMHKLFSKVENSPKFDSSLDESRLSGTEKQRKGPKINSQPVAKKTKVSVREDSGPGKSLRSTTVKDANKNNTDGQEQNSFNSQPISLSSGKYVDSSSDDDSMNVSGFFPDHNQKLPYSFDEDEEILRFVLKGQCIFRVSSLSLWKELEYRKGHPKRTYQSLKNRFLRSIKPHLFTTYRHLIPDEETVERILLKFPELRKDVGKKGTLPQLKLPERIQRPKVSEAQVSSTSLHENRSVKTTTAARKQTPEPVSSNSIPGRLNFHRKVKIVGDSMTVLVNLNFRHPPSKSTGIYEKYMKLKSQNPLVPCSACGRSNGPKLGDSSGSDAESDEFISNSVESKKSAAELRRKDIEREKQRTDTPSPQTCSQSLLNDVDAMGELDENGGESAEEKDKEAQEEEETANCVAGRKEPDSTPGEGSAEIDKDTDSIFESAVEQFRKVIDSDEEEVLVKKCLRKNMKAIGFDANLSVDAVSVDSFFLKSSSPGLESDSIAGSNPSEAESASGPSLMQNMMNMILKKEKK